MQRQAVFSDCRCYRYSLSRIWTATDDTVLFIGLNPSTADQTKDDPTIRRCIQFAQKWGFGGLHIVNLFAFRATKVTDLRLARDPIGPEADQWIDFHQKQADLVVAAWGNHGSYLNRSGDVMPRLINPYYLRINNTGQPAHPLYLPAYLQPRLWKKKPDQCMIGLKDLRGFVN